MNDIFTIVSIVIAISGATYAALGALREVLSVKLKKTIEDADATQ